jgi:hypothetical protein
MSRLILVAALALLMGCDDGDAPKSKEHADDDDSASSEQPEPEPSEDEPDESEPQADEDEPDGGEESEQADGGEQAAHDADAGELDGSGGDASGGDASATSDATTDAASSDASSLMSNWGDQACDKASTKPGCQDKALALCICRGPSAEGGNAFCCNERWSYVCVDGALSVSACKFVSNKCCEAHPGDGCETPQIEQCVCNEVQRMKREEADAGRDPATVHDCCREGWSPFCAILATTVCSATCT